MKHLNDKVVAITGAGSGIGRELALNLAREGCSLSLCDISGRSIEETAGMIVSDGIKVTRHIVDVANREQVYNWADETFDAHGRVDIIINNAGVAVSETIEDLSWEDFEWAFKVDFWGVVYGTKAFLPYLKKQSEGHIVNISSINAMLPFRNNAPYNCAKSAVKGFNETLIQELRGSSINVMSVHPGGVQTNIARNMRFRKHINEDKSHQELIEDFDRIASTTAEKAARVIIKGIKKDKKRLLVGLDAKFLDLLCRIFPVSANVITGIINGIVER